MTTTTPIHTLLLTFRLPLRPRQIPQWRGAFLELAGPEADLLHNHQPGEEQYHYRYPLVQYRVRNGLASIFALNEGIEAVQQVLFSKKWEIKWRGRPTGLIIENQPERQTYQLEVSNTRHRYHLRQYLALNADNYQQWQQSESLIERAQLLERVLRGHVLAGMWGLGWRGEEQVKVQLQEIRRSSLVPYHGQQLTAFDLVFDANVALPPGLAIGKAVSQGFGWMLPEIASEGQETLPAQGEKPQAEVEKMADTAGVEPVSA